MGAQESRMRGDDLLELDDRKIFAVLPAVLDALIVPLEKL